MHIHNYHARKLVFVKESDAVAFSSGGFGPRAKAFRSADRWFGAKPGKVGGSTYSPSALSTGRTAGTGNLRTA